jgi:phosphate transport system substrate-binding protein
MKHLFSLSFLIVFLVSCSPKKNKEIHYDTPLSGRISICSDESFKPVLDEQIKMYQISYPGTNIDVTYKPEFDCIRDFFLDSSVRMVVVSRPFTRKEEKFLSDSLHYIPGCQPVASDAVTLVINQKNSDSLFTLEQLRNDLLGKGNKEKLFVFDGLRSTSTVRYIRDSILKGANYDTSVVKAVRGNEEVLNYVSTHENAVGMVGISWIGNKEDSTQVKLLKTLKIGYVRCDICEGKPFVKPMQESMLTHRYPLVRKLYYMIKENYTGLGTGFTSFLKFERGQLIFRRSYLGPIMDLDIRAVQVNERIPEN